MVATAMDTSATSSSCSQSEPEVQWLHEFSATTEHINQLVMDYLVTEGYKEAAERFANEAGLADEYAEDEQLDPTLEPRIEIRKAIQQGNVEDAIQQINELCPELLDDTPYLHFHLLQQQTIELIRAGRSEEALDYAEEHLAEKGELLPKCLPEIERTLALLVFDKPDDCVFSDLMAVQHRQHVADEVNSAVLAWRCRDSRPRLECLVQSVLWSQSQLDAKNVHYDKMLNVATAQMEEPAAKKGMFQALHDRDRLR